MKKIISLLTVFALCTTVSFGQNNTSAKAKQILDQVSKKTKGYSSISLTYSLVHTSPEGSNDNANGDMLLKGNK